MLDVAWTLARGDVTLRAEALLSDEGPWARFLRPPSTDTRSLHAVAWTVSNPVARAGLDVPLPNLWPIVGTGEAPRTVATPFRDVVALVAGDLDGVAGDELVVVTSTTAYVGRFERGALRFSSAGGHSLGPAGWASIPARTVRRRHLRARHAHGTAAHGCPRIDGHAAPCGQHRGDWRRACTR